MKRFSGLVNRIKRNTFGKGILIIASGTALAQALGIVFSPIITRLYPPEQYGMLTTYAAVLGLLVISASLDYQNAIPIAEDDEKAINLLFLALLVLAFTSLLIFLAFLLFGNSFLNLLDASALSSYRFLIPLGVFFSGIYRIVTQWWFRERNYTLITRTRISQSIASNITKISLGLMKFGPIGLILGAIIGESAGIFSLSFPLFRRKQLLKSINKKQLLYVLKRYKKFPLYSAPSNYVYTAASNLTVVFLASLFGSTVTGLFGLANSIVGLPSSLIGASVAQVFYAEMATIGKTNPVEIKRQALSIMKKLALIGLIPFLIFVFFGPFLFSFVFGENWYEAGIYARILSLRVLAHFIIMPIGRILEIFERQVEGLIFNIIRLVMVLAIFSVAKICMFTSYQVIGLYSLALSITYILLFVLVMRILNQEISKQKGLNSVQ